MIKRPASAFTPMKDDPTRSLLLSPDRQTSYDAIARFSVNDAKVCMSALNISFIAV